MAILTAHEIKIVAFIVGAVLVGLGVQHYRNLAEAAPLLETTELTSNL